MQKKFTLNLKEPQLEVLNSLKKNFQFLVTKKW